MPMDDKLHIVQHLYGEGEDPAALQQLLEDAALREDYDALSDVKQRLDQRPPARPDPFVIDRIVAAAATPKAGVMPGKRQDRTARPNRRRYRLAGAFSGVLALVLVVGIGLNQYVFQQGEQAAPTSEAKALRQEAPAEAEAFAMEDAPADEEEAKPATLLNQPMADDADVALGGTLASTEQLEPEPSLADVQPPSPVQDGEDVSALGEGSIAAESVARSRAAAPAAVAANVEAGRRDTSLQAKEADVAPAWDEADDLLRVHRRIDMLRARSRELIWDESAVMSLDSLPQEPARTLPGLNAAGKRKQ